jgi:hypothetical protein
MEVAGNEISGETVRSGDDGPIPSQFVADYFFQLLDAAHAPRNLHMESPAGDWRWAAELEAACEVHHWLYTSD